MLKSPVLPQVNVAVPKSSPDELPVDSEAHVREVLATMCVHLLCLLYSIRLCCNYFHLPVARMQHPSALRISEMYMLYLPCIVRACLATSWTVLLKKLSDGMLSCVARCAACRYGDHLASMTVRKGSLLVALDVLSGGSLSQRTCPGSSFTKVPPARWLNWLQLPWPKDARQGIHVQVCDGHVGQKGWALGTHAVQLHIRNYTLLCVK